VEYQQDKKANLYLKFAASIWSLTLLVICIIVYVAPHNHTVTNVYREAVEKWMVSESLYFNTINAYFYFPQFVFIFFPFHLLPMPFGDILWRVVSAGLLFWAIWRIVSLSCTMQNELLFLYVSLVALIPSIGAMQIGQANALFAAMTVHAAACLARSQWLGATLCLVVALAVKPLGVVMILLAVVYYRPIIFRLVLGISGFFLLPFFFARSSYVSSQYRQAFECLFSASLVIQDRFADLNGLLRSLGMGLTGSASQTVRIGAGFLVMCLWWVGSRRTREPERAWLLLGLTANYLMLFNPWTEINSYVIVAPSIALYAIRFIKIDVHPKLGWALVFLGVSIGLFPSIFGDTGRKLCLWWCPLIAVFFDVILLSTIFSKRFLVRNSP
jgi:alpha-1,2-mannosyltransferase